jgi:uncharacterized protein YyaL (SSP411 family)
MMTLAYTEAFQVTGEERYKDTAREILTYVLRDMTDPQGGFYSAEDADSEGEEGLFYLWTLNEIRAVLTSEESDLYRRIYNLSEEGNYRDEVRRSKTGKNIPHLRNSLRDIAAALAISETELREKLEMSRKKLFASRELRIHPHRDDKILTDWNGMMIAALAKAGRVLGDTSFTSAAVRAAAFIERHLQRPDGRLYHRYRAGESGITASLDDHVFLQWGLLELYRATFRPEYLKWAVELYGMMKTGYWDGQNGGFFSTPVDGEKLLVRQKEIYDGAIPSGNSVAMMNALRLSRLTGDAAYESDGMAIAGAFAADVIQTPLAYTHLMAAIDFSIGPNFEIIISGDPRSADTRDMLKRLDERYLPNSVVLLQPAESADRVLQDIAGYLKNYRALDGRATAYVCRNFTCSLPTTDAGEMLSLLEKDRE